MSEINPLIWNREGSLIPKKFVRGQYESQDIIILRNALLKAKGLELDSHNLVIHSKTKTPYKSVSGFETHLVTPLTGNECAGLLETICKALLRSSPISPQQILFKYRMLDFRHWLTGQLLINKETITLKMHDSGNYYGKYGKELENIIISFFRLDEKRIAEFLAREGCTIRTREEQQKILKILFPSTGKPILPKLVESNIYRIQNGGEYCGGYATRLSVSLTIDPLQSLLDRRIWGAELNAWEADEKLRIEDALLIEKFCPEKVKDFANVSSGLEFRGSSLHKKKEKLQKKAEDKLIFEMEQILLVTNKDLIFELLQESIELERTGKEANHSIRWLYKHCLMNAKLTSLTKVIALFYQNPKEAITENSNFNSAVVLASLWQKFIELLGSECSKGKEEKENVVLSQNKTLNKAPIIKDENVLEEVVLAAEEVVLEEAEAETEEVEDIEEEKDEVGEEVGDGEEIREEESEAIQSAPLKDSSSSPISNPFNAIAVKSTISQRQTRKTDFSYKGQSSLSETVAAKSTNSMGQLVREKVPNLLDKGDNISWRKSHEGCLEKLLTMAQDLISAREGDPDKELTEDDLKYIVSCGRESTLSFSILSLPNTYKKIIRLSIKILSYLAENKRALSMSAIQLLLEKLEKKDNGEYHDDKIAFNALIAIAFVINNGQNLADIKENEEKWLVIFERKLRELMRSKDAVLYASYVTVGIAALSKKQVKLKKEDFDFLKKVLEYVGEEQFQKLYPQTRMHTLKSDISRIAWYQIRTLPILRDVKSLTKRGSLLATDEIEYASRYWTDESHIKYKRKSIQALRHMIFNGQRDFPSRDKVVNALEKSTNNKDRKLRANVVFGLGYLVNAAGVENKQYEKLRSDLNQALSKYKYYALQAINYYLYKDGNNLPDVKEFLELLVRLQSDHNNEVINLATIIFCRMTKNVDNLECLLLEPSYSAQITYDFLNMVKHGTTLKKEILEKLANILIGSKPSYPEEARYNSILILKQVVENHQKIPKITFDALIEYTYKTQDKKIWNETCCVIGAYAKDHIHEVIQQKEVLDLILKFLSKRPTVFNAAVALQNIVQKSDKLDNNKSQAFAIGVITQFIRSDDYNEETNNVFSLILLHAAKKGHKFSGIEITRISEALLQKNKILIRGKLLETIKYAFEQSDGQRQPPELLMNLLQLLEDDSELIRHDANSLLITYIQNGKFSVPEFFVEEVLKHIAKARSALYASEILKNIVNRNWDLPINILDMISKALNYDNDEIQINIATIFNAKLGELSCSEFTFKNVLQVLEKNENQEVAALIVSALQKPFSNKWLEKIGISSELIQKLISLLEQPGTGSEFKMGIANILFHAIQKENCNLSNRAICNLGELLGNGEYEVANKTIEVLRIQLSKIEKQKILRRYEPKSIEALINKIEQLLSNDDYVDAAVLFLRNASRLEFTFSKKTLDNLGNVLLSNSDQAIRIAALDILSSKGTQKDYSQNLKNILELEICGKCLERQGKENQENQQNALEKIKYLTTNGQFLTFNNMATLEKLVNTRNHRFIKTTLEIIYLAIRNNQKIHFNLINSITDFLESESIKKTKNEEALELTVSSLAELANKGEYLPEKIYKIFEELIIHNRNKNLDKALLSVVELAAKKRKILAKDTIIKILCLVESQDSIIRFKSLNTLCYVAEKNDLEFCIEKITHLLKAHVKQQEIAIGLSKTIKIIVGKTKFFDLKMIEVLFELLNKGNIQLEIEKNIIAIFETIQLKQRLPDEILHLIELRKEEHKLINEKEAEKNLLTLAKTTQVLSQNINKLSQISLENLEKLLKQPNADIKKLILEKFAELPKKMVVPDSMLIVVCSLLSNPDCYVLASQFVGMAIISQKRFPPEAVHILAQMMVEDSNFTIREVAFGLLQRLHKSALNTNQSLQLSLKSKANSILYSHPNCDKKIIEEYLANLSQAPCFSRDSCEIINKLLADKNHWSHSKILQILMIEKGKIPSYFHLALLNILIQLPSEKDNDEKIVDICRHILKTNYLESNNLASLVKCLEKQLCQGNLTTERFRLLTLVLSQSNFSLNCNNIIIKSLFSAKEETKQKEILNLLFIVVNKSRNLSREDLQVLTQACKQLITNSQTMNLTKNSQKRFIKLFLFVFRQHSEFFTAFNSLEELKKYVNQTLFSSKQFSDQLNKLKPYKQAELLLTLLSIEPFNKDQLLKCKDLKEYAAELETNDLLAKIKKVTGEFDEQTHKTFYDHLYELRESKRHIMTKEEFNGFLSLLAERQTQEKFKINELLQFFVIFRNSTVSPLLLLAEEGKLRNICLKFVLEDFIECCHLEKQDISTLWPLFERVGWSINFIQLFLEKVKESNEISSVSLSNLLNFICQCQIKEEMLFNVFELINAEEDINLHQWPLILQQELIKEQLYLIKDIAEKNKLVQEYSYRTPNLERLLLSKITQLLNMGWNFQSIYQFIKKLTNKVVKNEFFNIDAIYKVFDITYCYKRSEPDLEKCLEKILDDPKNGVQEFHLYAILAHFSEEGSVKDLKTILSEFRGEKEDDKNKKNKENPALLAFLKDEDIIGIFTKIAEFEYKIQNWDLADILAWSYKIGERAKDNNTLPEILAIIKHAARLHFGKSDGQEGPKEIREVQILTVLVFLYSQENLGRLTENLPGEGKSLIIAVLAIIYGLRKETVDIVNSAPDLAKEGFRGFKDFYKCFGLQSALNEDKGYVKGLKACYAPNVNIRYGYINEFQFDILRDEYSGLGTRGKRGFDRVIIDEVDNLLIDEGAKIAMLADVMAGMGNLKPLYILLPIELRRIELRLFEDNGILYYPDENLEKEGAIPKRFIVKDKNAFIQNKLQTYLKAITTKNEKGEIGVITPTHLQEFVNIQLPKWTKNVALASHCEKGREYMVKPNKESTLSVAPVDFENTGTVQMGTTWGDGLQQFIQIKHGLELTAESLVVNFISNMAFIKRYKNKICGLTGTLGSKEAQKLLADIYNIDFVHIPTFKERRFLEHRGVIATNGDHWLNEIEASVLRELPNRVVLLICQDINKVDAIEARIKESAKANIIKYNGNEDQIHFLNSQLNNNTVIIATNVAGRGTDVKLIDFVNRHGGLHVGLTFLPHNWRPELQSLLRTSRNGNPGTAQLILNLEDIVKKFGNLPEFDLKRASCDIDYLRGLRDVKEKEHLDHCRNNELPETEIKDQLFGEFRPFLKSLMDGDVSEDGKYKRMAVIEAWGIWLKAHDQRLTKETLAEFLIFKEQLLKEYQNNMIIKNPFYYINQGTDYLVYVNSLKGKFETCFTNWYYEKSIECFDKAIELDPISSYMAHYNKIYSLIYLKKGDYKEEIKKHLRACINIVEKTIIPQTFPIVQCLGIHNGSKLHVDLLEQFNHKMQALNELLTAAKQNLHEVELSQRLMDVEVSSVEGNNSFQKLNKFETLDVVRKLGGSIHPLTRAITVNFHGLSVSSDLGTSFQAEETLNSVKEDLTVSIIFDGISDKVLLKKLLPMNRYEELNKEVEKLGEEEQEKQEKTITLGDRLYNFKDGVSKFASSVASSASELVSPIKKRYRKVKDSWYRYDQAEKILVHLDMEYKTTQEIQDIMNSWTKDSLSEDSCTIDLNIKNLSKECMEAILSAHLGHKAKLLSRGVEQHKLLKQKCHVQKHDLKEIKEVKELQEDQEEYYLRFEKVSLEDINGLLTSLNGVFNKLDDPNLIFPIFGLSINQLTQKQAQKMIELSKTPITLRFENLNKKDAIVIIYLTEGHNRDATFKVKNLNTRQAAKLVESADRSDEDLDISLTPIEEVIPRLNQTKMELSEYQHDGLMYLFKLKEKNPIPWKSVAILIVLGIAQITAGILLAGGTMGFGATFGVSLIAEGIADIMRGMTAYYTREFSWSSYLVQKSISIVINIATAGLASLHLNEIGTAGFELMDDAAMAALMSKNMGKEGFQVATKQILATTVETTATAAASKVIDTTVQAGLDIYRPIHANQIRGEMNKRIVDGDWRFALNRLFMIDEFIDTGPIHYQKVRCEGDSIIKSLGLGTMGLNMITSQEFLQFDQKFSEDLKKKVDTILSFEELLVRRHGGKAGTSLSKEEAKAIADTLRKHKILLDNGTINLQGVVNGRVQGIEDIHFGVHEDYRSEIIEDCRVFADLQGKDYYRQRISLSEELTKTFSNQYFRVINTAAAITKVGLTTVVNMGVSRAAKKIAAPSKPNGPGPNKPGASASERPGQTIQSRPPSAQDIAKKIAKRSMRAAAMQSKHRDARVLLHSRHQHGKGLSSTKEKLLKLGNPVKPSRTAIPSSRLVPGMPFLSEELTEALEKQMPSSLARQFMEGNEAAKKQSIKLGDILSQAPNLPFESRVSNLLDDLSVPRLPKENLSKIFSPRSHDEFREFQQRIQDRIKMQRDVNPLLVQRVHSSPGQITFRDPDFNMALKVSLAMMQESFFIAYRQELQIQHEQRMQQITQLGIEHSEKSSELCRKVLEQEKKKIRIYVGIIVIEAKFNFSLLSLDVSPKSVDDFTKIIKKDIDDVFGKCMAEPEFGFQFVENYVNRLFVSDWRIRKSLMTLKKLFFEFNQTLLKEKSMSELAGKVVTKFSNDVNFGDVTKDLFGYLKDQQYSQCGLLLRDGKLGESGFLAGTLIEGMVKCHLTTTQAHARMQFMLTNIVSKAVECHYKFVDEVIALKKEEVQFRKQIAELLENSLKDIMNLLVQAMNKSDDTFKLMSKNVELLVPLAHKKYDAQMKLLDATRIDPGFYTACVNTSKAIVETVTLTARELGKHEASVLNNLTSATRDKLSKILGPSQNGQIASAAGAVAAIAAPSAVPASSAAAAAPASASSAAGQAASAAPSSQQMTWAAPGSPGQAAAAPASVPASSAAAAAPAVPAAAAGSPASVAPSKRAGGTP